MKTKAILAILILGMLLICTLACGDPGAPEATPTPTLTPTPTPTPKLTQCERDRDAVQAVLYDYYQENGEWPTETGGPGDIDWEKLVPSHLFRIPVSDVNCDWSVNSDPEGEMCVGPTIGCVECKCPCSARCAE